MIPACLPPRPVSRPKVPPPQNACDTHAHVFGPADVFPYTADRSYTPPDAPLEKYLAMLDTLGFARGALVQGSAHGRDNGAMLDALARHPARLRGVAVADENTPPAELRRWDAQSPKQVMTPADYPDVRALETEWKTVEREQQRFLAELTDGKLTTQVAYENLQGQRWEYSLGHMMQHVVNHSSYHRGQVVTLLRQMGHAPQATDANAPRRSERHSADAGINVGQAP